MENRESFTLKNEEILGEQGQIFKTKNITDREGKEVPLNGNALVQVIQEACHGLEDKVSTELIQVETDKNLYEGIPEKDLINAIIMAARPFIERDPAYTYVNARLLLQNLFQEVLGLSLIHI